MLKLPPGKPTLTAKHQLQPTRSRLDKTCLPLVTRARRRLFLLQPITNPSRSQIIRASTDQGSVSTEGFQGILSSIEGLNNKELRTLSDKDPIILSLRFLQWLAERQAVSEHEESRQLWTLCGRLVAIREQIDTAGLDQVREAIAFAQANGALLAPAGPQESGLLGAPAGLQALTDVEERRRALASHQAAAALSPEQTALAEQQVEALADEMRERRSASALQLMGRKQLTPEDLVRGFGATDAAPRILQALLDVPESAARLQLLPEAFVEAPEGNAPAPDAKDELLSTSPLRLLQAVDHRLAEMDRSPAVPLESPYQLTSGLPQSDERAALLELREAIFSWL